MVTEGGGCGEADLAGDAVDRPAGGLQQTAGALNALFDEPAARAGTGLLLEAAGEGPAAHARVGGEFGAGERDGEAFQRPGAGGRVLAVPGRGAAAR